MKCKRCGCCCENVAISLSPKELKKNYEAWIAGNKKIEHYEEIYLLYPMLEYKRYNKKYYRYVYKCKFLKYEYIGCKNRLATRHDKKIAICSIQDNKPKMCKKYGMEEKLSMGIVGSFNKELYPTCVF
jgi:Fe-S-cluster containining protein